MKRVILVAAFVIALSAGSALGIFVGGWGSSDASIVPVVSAASGGSSGGAKEHGGEYCEVGGASGMY